MIKLLHAADLHLDSPFASLDPDAAELLRQKQRELLDAIAEKCRTLGVDLLLFSGDIFDSTQLYRDTLLSLQSALERCAVPVFIANHDNNVSFLTLGIHM